MNIPQSVKDFLKKEINNKSTVKYALSVLIVLVYAIFVSVRFGLEEGAYITILTWSFLVFCTPVADAGFILDLPIRLITGLRMIYTEIAVWLIALAINLVTIAFAPEIYSKTILLDLFYHILSQPIPYWGIIILSAIGTFLSIYFADELMDVVTHEHRHKYKKHLTKYKIVIFIFIIALILLLYDFMIKKLGIQIRF